MYRVRLGAMELELATLEEVAELHRRVAGGQQQFEFAVTASAAPTPPTAPTQAPIPFPSAPPPAPRPVSKGGWDYASARKLLDSVSPNARKFLGRLVTLRRVGSVQMANDLNVGTNALGPAIRSITTQTKALAKKTPFSIATDGDSKKVFVLNREFASAVMDYPSETKP
jgi:hypothetical protein